MKENVQIIIPMEKFLLSKEIMYEQSKTKEIISKIISIFELFIRETIQHVYKQSKLHIFLIIHMIKIKTKINKVHKNSDVLLLL